jgi:glyoxylase-like metal-dependent hydrolase (beta-lactamase superfamily II)
VLSWVNPKINTAEIFQEIKAMMKGKTMKKNKLWGRFILFGLSFLLISCSKSGDLVVLHQVTGPVSTNCFLFYDTQTKEAALIDVGGPIDTLVAHIQENDLDLKYIFATHAHMDHVEGVPQIQEKFPGALLCYNKKDYEDFLIAIDWLEESFPEDVAEMKESPEFSKWFEYDMTIFKEPDIYLEDNQTYMLGNLEIRTFLSPAERTY